ncbi:MAG TPA: zinc ribbon domain-containing protein [Gemmatimonadaceae bacterium]|nr:zinc ribbon domain-containing protein [Gemmatimonadaceae bacterium]
MPLYEFRCPDGHDFEKFYRSIGSAAAEEKCPVCGAVAVRLMSTAGLVFKGSGFYITDYGKDGKKAEREAASLAATADKKKADKESSSSDSSAKTETTSTDSKPAAAESTAKPAAEPSAKPAASTTESKPAKPAAPKAKPTKTA